MNHRTLMAAVALVVAGCSSTHLDRPLSFPSKDVTVYDAPDGRTWVRHEMIASHEGIYTINFTPTQAEKGKWSEMLSFGMTAEDMSAGRTKEKLELLKREDDHDLTFSIEDLSDGNFQTVHSPRWNEDSVERNIRKGATTVYVTYSQRLGPAGAEKLRFWAKRIRNWPNQAREATATAVMPAAGQPPRQP